MEHLLEEDKLTQLRSIFDGISTCGSICGDLLNSVNCGCNG